MELLNVAEFRKQFDDAVQGEIINAKEYFGRKLKLKKFLLD